MASAWRQLWRGVASGIITQEANKAGVAPKLDHREQSEHFLGPRVLRRPRVRVAETRAGHVELT